MNREWQSFLESVPWFMKHKNHVEVGVTQEPGRWTEKTTDFPQHFSALERLLKMASVTDLTIDGAPHELFSWRRRDGGDCAWL